MKKIFFLLVIGMIASTARPQGGLTAIPQSSHQIWTTLDDGIDFIYDTAYYGGTLYSFAQKHFGNGERWPELLYLNPSLTDPGRTQVNNRGKKFTMLFVGEVIKVPVVRSVVPDPVVPNKDDDKSDLGAWLTKCSPEGLLVIWLSSCLLTALFLLLIYLIVRRNVNANKLNNVNETIKPLVDQAPISEKAPAIEANVEATAKVKDSKFVNETSHESKTESVTGSESHLQTMKLLDLAKDLLSDDQEKWKVEVSIKNDETKLIVEFKKESNKKENSH